MTVQVGAAIQSTGMRRVGRKWVHLTAEEEAAEREKRRLENVAAEEAGHAAVRHALVLGVLHIYSFAVLDSSS